MVIYIQRQYLPFRREETSRVFFVCFSWNRDNAIDKTIFGSSNMANIILKLFIEYLLTIIFHLINSAILDPEGTFTAS